MQISGTVTDSQGKPVGNVKIELSADGVRSAVVYSDDHGHFSHSDSASHTGGVLTLRAEKTGFVAQELTQPIAADTMVVDFTMDAVGPVIPWRMIAFIGGGVLAIGAIVVVLLFVFGEVKTEVEFSGFDSARVVTDGEFADRNIERIFAAPPARFCRDAVAVVLPGGNLDSPVSFLSTASRAAMNRCNDVPLEIVFTKPVRDVTIHVSGRRGGSAYVLEVFAEDGTKLGQAVRTATSSDDDTDFLIEYESGEDTIKRIRYSNPGFQPTPLPNTPVPTIIRGPTIIRSVHMSRSR